jgi:hypothetical protein
MNSLRGGVCDTCGLSALPRLYGASGAGFLERSEFLVHLVQIRTLRVHGLQVALQSREPLFRKSQPLMSGFEWIIILFVGVIPFRAAEVVAEALGCSHLVALACGIVVMAICVLGYFAIRPRMLPD